MNLRHLLVKEPYNLKVPLESLSRGRKAVELFAQVWQVEQTVAGMEIIPNDGLLLVLLLWALCPWTEQFSNHEVMLIVKMLLTAAVWKVFKISGDTLHLLSCLKW